MTLKKYQWKNRLLILNTENVTEALPQKEAFVKSQVDNQDRHLIMVEVNRNQKELWEQFSFEAGVFLLVLIGKDGEVKQIYDKVQPMPSIYKIIDSMLMRQQEMREEQ